MRRHNAHIQRLDRRKFLLGAGGAMLALPMLEAYAPRIAFGQSAAPPKRLVVILHPHGRTVGNGRREGGVMQDNWSPLAQTGPYPATGDLSPMLAALGDVRQEIVTVDNVDNLVRHMTGDADGHASASITCMTCAVPKAGMKGGGPSIDYVAGERLRASAAQRSALVFRASPMEAEWRYDGGQFYRDGGTPPTLVDSNPAVAINDLFASLQPMTNEPPPEKTLHNRLVARRGSILDSVAKSYTDLGKKLSQADRDRLEQHANFIRTVETRFSGGGPTVLAQGCARPDEATIPNYDPTDNERGALDGMVTPWNVENLVMALACDVTRVAAFHFQLAYDPIFQSEFTGTSPLGGGNNYHTMVHETGALSDPNRPSLTTAFQFHGKMVARLIKRLSEVIDSDGSRLLDNTLVLWVGDMGYGAGHLDYNNPVLLAGMKSAFPNGQGRHVVLPERRSLGDLYAQALRMVGGTDTTFGATGKLGDSGFTSSSQLNAQSGYDKFVTSNLPLHLGPLEI